MNSALTGPRASSAWRERAVKVLEILRRRSTRDLLVTTTGNAAVVVLSATGGILAARLLGPVGRGELAAAIVWAGVLGTVAQLGLPQAITYFTAREPERCGEVLSAAVVLSVVQSAVVLLLSWPAVDMVLGRTQPGVVAVVHIYLLSIPAANLTTYLATVAQGLGKFVLFGWLRLMASAGYALALTVAMVANMHDSKSVSTTILLGQAVAAAGALVVFWAAVRPPIAWRPGRIRRLVNYGLRSWMGSLSWIANARLDQFVMSSFIGMDQLGYYAVSVSYAGVMFPILGAFPMVLFPRVAGDDSARGKRKIWLTLKAVSVVSLLGALLLGLIAPVALPWLFGVPFSPAVEPALILLGGTVLLACNYVASDGLRGLGHPLVPSIAELAGLAMTLCGLAVLVPRFGIIGAAWVSVLSYGTVLAVLVLRLTRVSPAPEAWAD